jgi:hypothetical protein
MCTEPFTIQKISDFQNKESKKSQTLNTGSN